MSTRHNVLFYGPGTNKLPEVVQVEILPRVGEEVTFRQVVMETRGGPAAKGPSTVSLFVHEVEHVIDFHTDVQGLFTYQIRLDHDKPGDES